MNTNKCIPIQNYFVKKQKLTQAEMLARREQGLGYNCDKKYHKQHNCKAFLLTAEDKKENALSDAEELCMLLNRI